MMSFNNVRILSIMRFNNARDSTMCGYFRIEFIDFISKGKSLLDYTNLFSPNGYEKNNKINKNIFNNSKDKKNYIVLCAASIENLGSLKYHTF